MSKLGVGAAGVVASLAAIGVAGPLLARMIRNHPSYAWWTVIPALIAGALLILVATSGWWRRILVVAIAATAVLAVQLGVDSYQEREQPHLEVEATADAASISITAKAAATSLRSGEHLALGLRGVRVAGAGNGTTDGTYGSLRQLCYGQQVWTAASANQALGGGIEEVRELGWAESGPDQEGDGSTELSTRVAPGRYDLVCAWVTLQRRGPMGADPNGSRGSVAGVVLPQASPAPAAKR